MAFSFFGTFTSGQWEVFRAFSQIQAKELRLRRQWLEKQLSMTGVFVTEYDGPRPISFSASPGSYAAKLLQAYRILGGVPEQDMLLRTRDKPVFKVKGSPISSSGGSSSGGFSDVYSNGRRERGTQRYDRDLGLRVERLKSWQLEAVKFKRERLEYKILRAMDHSDQIQQEIMVLEALLGDESARGSFENQLLEVEIQMATPGTMNVVQDLDDVFGLGIGRPGDMTYSDALKKAEEDDQRLP